MSRELRWRRRALDDLSEIGRRNPAAARRIGEALDRFVRDGYGDVLKLEGEVESTDCAWGAGASSSCSQTGAVQSS